MQPANAAPTKSFFIGNLTRDLSLEDAILDLIDNSVDGLVRSRQLNVTPDLLRSPKVDQANLHTHIEISLAPDRFEIADRCGGIGVERAQKYAFRFGNLDPSYTGSLGVYGIGMKRALFKLGKRIEIESRTVHDGFSMTVDVDSWSKDDSSWTLPMSELQPAAAEDEAGTRIVVTKLSPEIVLRLRDPQLVGRLMAQIGRTYALFLTRFTRITVNGMPVNPMAMPLARSAELKAGFANFVFGDVQVELVAGLAERTGGEWKVESAGWYVLCNGRVVVAADRTELTGWGIRGPQFVSKFRGFIGIAFFFSRDAGRLPWTTTKRGLNQESEVYQRARAEMTVVARPVLTFLNSMYASDPAEGLVERQMASQLEPADLTSIVTGPAAPFSATYPQRRKRTTVSVQFKAERTEVDRIRKRLGKPSTWAAGNAGRYAFDYYLKRECPS